METHSSLFKLTQKFGDGCICSSIHIYVVSTEHVTKVKLMKELELIAKRYNALIT